MISYDRAEAAATAANIDEALATAAPLPYWLDHPDRPDALPHLSADTSADLAIVGGGYTGLWTALLAKERDPGRRRAARADVERDDRAHQPLDLDLAQRRTGGHAEHGAALV